MIKFNFSKKNRIENTKKQTPKKNRPRKTYKDLVGSVAHKFFMILFKDKKRFFTLLLVIDILFSFFIFNQHVLPSISGDNENVPSIPVKKVKIQKSIYNEILEEKNKRSDYLNNILDSEYDIGSDEVIIKNEVGKDNNDNNKVFNDGPPIR